MQDLPKDMRIYIRINSYINCKRYTVENLQKRIRFLMPNVPLHQIQGDEDGQSECIGQSTVTDIEMSDDVKLITD